MEYLKIIRNQVASGFDDILPAHQMTNMVSLYYFSSFLVCDDDNLTKQIY